ncbi:hypothetical protein HYPSUDRAFT_60403 [Hypholoma sublateritium FD-334 SS-4]|uniref:Uncharacterized protein n=1 Tax=Hypholoma sublateritium (strain FD-334 SS-4) TaxID=945553 RepID=A0A0D2PFL0_HYPSF|nr:hypothetical protein HYPSUDRAFT_60403 [Hypholoma sublateritium FD-334 SS-4]
MRRPAHDARVMVRSLPVYRTHPRLALRPRTRKQPCRNNQVRRRPPPLSARRPLAIARVAQIPMAASAVGTSKSNVRPKIRIEPPRVERAGRVMAGQRVHPRLSAPASQRNPARTPAGIRAAVPVAAPRIACCPHSSPPRRTRAVTASARARGTPPRAAHPPLRAGTRTRRTYARCPRRGAVAPGVQGPTCSGPGAAFHTVRASIKVAGASGHPHRAAEGVACVTCNGRPTLRGRASAF